MNKYNSKRINCSTGIDDWKNFKKDKPLTALNMFYFKEINIYSTYISKRNLNHEK